MVERAKLQDDQVNSSKDIIILILLIIENKICISKNFVNKSNKFDII